MWRNTSNLTYTRRRINAIFEDMMLASALGACFYEGWTKGGVSKLG